MATDFPKKGDNKKISLRNSNYPVFDKRFAAGLKENNPEIWKAGGNIEGNRSFRLLMKALDGDETPEVLEKIKEREAWIARHFEDGKQFKSGDKPARPSNIAGVVAQIKWLSIGTLGERGMKDVILEAIKYLELKESGSASQAQQDRQVSSTVEKGLKNKVEEHNEKVGNVASKRTTYRTLLAVFERGIGAYKTNPASVRPNVTSPEQWAYARVNSFLFALRNGRFQGGKHDLDLLPKSHPLSSKEEKAMKDKEDRHILNVNETDDSVIIEFAKHHEDKEEEMEMTESERPYHDEDEDKDRKDDKEDRKVLEMPMKFRTIDLSKARSIDEEKRTVRIGVSSETPVERSFGMEVLGHSEDEINMEFMQSKTAPLLLDHDMKKQIGVVEEFKLDQAAKRTTAVVRFGKSALAEEVFRDVVDGIRMNISVGYRVDKLERQNKDDETYYRASWTPMEISSVSIPADASRLVGVGRSKDKQTLNTTKVKIMENEKQEINLDEVRSKSVDEARKEFQKNSKEIIDLGVRHNKRDLANQAIKDGVSVEEFRGELLENISNDVSLETPTDIGLTEKETKRFSIMRAINAMANPTDRKAQEAAKFEFECSEAAQRAYGKTAQGVMLPDEVLRNWNQRDLSAGSDGDLIGQDYRAGDFIDVLRNNSAVMPMATMLNGLSGDVKIPRKTAASTAAFISSEGGAAGESEFTVGSVSMSPKTLGAFTDVTRQLMIQSSIDVENLIRNDLAQSMAIAIDDAALEGSGSSGNPTGITNTSGINSVSLSSAAAPTFAEMVSMETAVRVDNALLGDLAYIVHPTNYGTLKTTEKATNTAQFVAVNDEINGYKVVVSPQLTANNYVFGNFNDLLVGMFGGLDLVVDPYSNSSSGTVRIVALQSVDVAVRHAVSFCAAS
nr:phage major capsid protein [uncultured Mediterranean phage uvMED]BAR29310.1 phage major capsid protein [uncultured Mediterranean phage uvMED]BAR29329.1 phage major capsid protein [uncultured Mediterranean phage uvMED]BAR29359.1 phage major capsid protein [uncultured Mediterranean phage uvMED]BAR29400.1 phage major capsid protein [uncultured Mediterranean phage uvMED]